MDYEKTDWKDTSTPVDAEHLNKIEEGIYESNITADAGAKDIASLNDDVSEISKKVTSNEEAINELNTNAIVFKKYMNNFTVEDMLSDWNYRSSQMPWAFLCYGETAEFLTNSSTYSLWQGFAYINNDSIAYMIWNPGTNVGIYIGRVDRNTGNVNRLSFISAETQDIT